MTAVAPITDPVEAMLAQETAVDHSKAKWRGERVLGLCDRVASTLDAQGLLRASRDDVRAELFHVIADDLYGDAAIDVPTLRGGR